MKKQAVIFYAVLFSVAIGIGLSSCKGSPKTDESKGSGEAEGATVNLTLEIMASDILHELSDHSTDPMYLKAFAIATERQKADTTAHFIDLFGKAWEEQNPDARLAFVFGTYRLRDRVRPDSPNSEVIGVLTEKYEEAIANTRNNLCARLDRYGAANVLFRCTGVSSCVVMTADNVADTQRVRQLLTQRGKLEFWETYNSIGSDIGVYDLLYAANEMLTGLVEKAPLPEDSSAEEPIYHFPLFSILTPSIEGGYSTPCVGQALESDTAKVNEILRIPEMRNILPPSLRLLWTVRPNYNGLYELIAIKVNSRDGRAPLDGEVIADARAEEEDRGWAISVVMTAEGAKHWANLTDYNIDQWIAIVLDDKVYSYSYVLSEITGGKISIPRFTESEAKEMALVLKSGMLPVPVRLVEEDSGR